MGGRRLSGAPGLFGRSMCTYHATCGELSCTEKWRGLWKQSPSVWPIHTPCHFLTFMHVCVLEKTGQPCAYPPCITDVPSRSRAKRSVSILQQSRPQSILSSLNEIIDPTLQLPRLVLFGLTGIPNPFRSCNGPRSHSREWYAGGTNIFVCTCVRAVVPNLPTYRAFITSLCAGAVSVQICSPPRADMTIDRSPLLRKDSPILFHPVVRCKRPYRLHVGNSHKHE